MRIKIEREKLAKLVWALVGAILGFLLTIFAPFVQDYVRSVRDGEGVRIVEVWFPESPSRVFSNPDDPRYRYPDRSPDWINRVYRPPPAISGLFRSLELEQISWSETFNRPDWSHMCAKRSGAFYAAEFAPRILADLEAASIDLDVFSNSELAESEWFHRALYGDDLDWLYDMSSLDRRMLLGDNINVLRNINRSQPELELFPKWSMAVENRTSRPIYIRRVGLEIVMRYPAFEGGGDDYGISASKIRSAATIVLDLAEVNQGLREIWIKPESPEDSMVASSLPEPIITNAGQFVVINLMAMKSVEDGSHYWYLLRAFVTTSDDEKVYSHPFCFLMP